MQVRQTNRKQGSKKKNLINVRIKSLLLSSSKNTVHRLCFLGFGFATLPKATRHNHTNTCTRTRQMPPTAKNTNALVVHCPGLLPGRTITRQSHQLINGRGHTHTPHALVPLFVYHYHIKGITLVAKLYSVGLNILTP